MAVNDVEHCEVYELHGDKVRNQNPNTLRAF